MLTLFESEKRHFAVKVRHHCNPLVVGFIQKSRKGENKPFAIRPEGHGAPGDQEALGELERLFEAAPDRYEITIFNAEPRVNYDRIMLSPVLAGEKTFDQIVINDAAWYADNDITLLRGTGRLGCARKTEQYDDTDTHASRPSAHRFRISACRPAGPP